MPKKLLVADDSLTIQKVIRLALSGAASTAGDGYDIQAVSDGNDAVQQISLFRPDVVLIDVSLPGKSAFEVKRATNLHRDLDHVRFVLMSSAFEKVDERQVQEVEFHGRLTKPFDPAHLREVLTQVLANAPGPSSPPPIPATKGPSFENEPRFEAPTPPLQLAETSFDLPEPPEPENDIRSLTESTIRMSGLADLEKTPEPPAASDDFSDDFGWTIEEPSLKPPSSTDAGNSTFPLAPPPKYPNDHSRFIQHPTQSELTPPPLPPELDDDEPTDYLEPPTPSQWRPESQAAGLARRAAAQQERAEAPSFEPQSPTPPFTLDEGQLDKKIEDAIRREIEKAIRKLAQDTLPEVAERVLKEEIHKLLLDSS